MFVAEADDMAQEVERLEGALDAMEETRDEALSDLQAARVEITDLESDIEAAHGEIETLKDEAKEMAESIDKLRERVDDLEDIERDLTEKVEELEDQIGDLDAALNAEKTFNEAARTLVSALETYLSWLDNPPPNMGEDARAQFLTNFRRDLDAALREVG